MLILDFDGTVTDAEKEGRPFRAGYLEDLAGLTGHDLDEIHAMAERFEADIAADPDSHGWEFDGRIVAPATVDPYLRIMPVARKILDACGVFRDPVDRTRLLDSILYKYNYQKTSIAFRAGAHALLSSLRAAELFVVTNSHTEPVQNKIRALAETNELDWLIPRVRGRARKYIVDDSFNQVAASLALPGLSRPVLLRRRHYHDVIAELLARTRSGWAELLVVGDIFELDLALPLCKGARVALVVNQYTPAYERAYVEAHPRGHVVHDLAEIPALLG